MKIKKVSILLLEDNRLLREGIAKIIAEQPDLRITHAIGDCSKAAQCVRDSEPDVLLLDLGLGNQNSLRLVRDLKINFTNVKVIVMDLIPSQEDILRFVQAGVSGFILKDADLNDFLGTIRLVAGGAKVLPPFMTHSLFSQIINMAISDKHPEKVTEAVRMTKRERQVIEQVSEGLTNKEIAQMLHLSTFTIKSHIHNILEKLALHTRVQIAKYASTSADLTTVMQSISLIDEQEE